MQRLQTIWPGKIAFQRGKNLDRKGCHEVELLIVSQEVPF